MGLIPRNRDNKRTHERLRLVTARHKVYVWPEGNRGDPIAGFGFVADFSDEGVGIYLSERIRVRTPLYLAFEDIQAVTYRGNVVWTERVNLRQGFYGHDALNFRIGIKFLFASEAERQRYLEYFSLVQKRVQQITLGI